MRAEEHAVLEEVGAVVDLRLGLKDPFLLASGRVEAAKLAVKVADIKQTVAIRSRRGEANLGFDLPFVLAGGQVQGVKRAVETADVDCVVLNDGRGLEGLVFKRSLPKQLGFFGQARRAYAG